MRCARCDRIVGAESLGRTPDGDLVFGWCRPCLIEEHCRPVEPAGMDLKVRDSPSLARRARKARRAVSRWAKRPRSPAASRRLAALGISGLMAAWALILAFIGGLKLAGPGRGQGTFLLAGSGLMALVSLSVWLGVIGRIDRLRIGLQILQVAATTVAFGTIGWGIFHPKPSQNPQIIAIAAVSLMLFWSARRYERARFVVRDRAKTTVL